MSPDPADSDDPWTLEHVNTDRPVTAQDQHDDEMIAQAGKRQLCSRAEAEAIIRRNRGAGQRNPGGLVGALMQKHGLSREEVLEELKHFGF